MKTKLIVLQKTTQKGFDLFANFTFLKLPSNEVWVKQL